MSQEKTVALIVGGSSGMGRATAERLLKRGVGVHLAATRHGAFGQYTRRSFPTLGPVLRQRAWIYTTKPPSSGSSRRLREREDHIRYLVNAAGYFYPRPYPRAHQEKTTTSIMI